MQSTSVTSFYGKYNTLADLLAVASLSEASLVLRSMISLSASLVSFIFKSIWALRVFSSLRPWTCSLESMLWARSFFSSKSRSLSFTASRIVLY